MTDLTVQRTLVKSPPELWSELSEVESLARHLGEFGEIRITRAAPETTVAWEGEHASGTVEIEPSGWGTKVTLTAEVAEPEPAEPEPEAPEPEPAEPEPAGPEPEAAEPEQVEPEPARAEQSDAGQVRHESQADRLSDELGRIADRAHESYWDDLVHWGDHEAEAPASKPRRGRFARFFRRRPRREPIEGALAAERIEDDDDAAPSEEAASAVGPSPPAGVAVVQPEPEAVAPAEPKVAAVAEPEAAATAEPEPPAIVEPEPPAIAPDHARAVLEHALDNLGAAHHRPFSRG